MSPRTTSGLHLSNSSLLATIFLISLFSVLNPCISYQGLLADCGDDIWLKSHLKLAKERLKNHYREQYMPLVQATLPQPTAPQLSSSLPQKVNFTARYKQWSRTDVDELEEFWKLPNEDFKNCGPIQLGQLKSTVSRFVTLCPGYFRICGEFLFCVLVQPFINLAQRVCCRCRMDFLRQTWYNIIMSCESAAGDYQDINAG